MGVASLQYPGDTELEQGSWPSGSHDLSVPHKNVPCDSGAGIESQMYQWGLGTPWPLIFCIYSLHPLGKNS